MRHETMTVKLIAFDLDGTLLDDDKHLPPENLAALQAAYERGIFLVPATGRILKALPEELLAPGLFRYFIFANGALVYDLQEQRALPSSPQSRRSCILQALPPA